MPQLPELLQYRGKWAASKDRKVVTVADTPLELVHKMKALGDAAKGALPQYGWPDDDVITIGLG